MAEGSRSKSQRIKNQAEMVKGNQPETTAKPAKRRAASTTRDKKESILSTTAKRARKTTKAVGKILADEATPKIDTNNNEPGTVRYWLMKAEPDSRIVKGKDVKFRTSQWDGVRNFEARNIMRDRMKTGDKVLFYHSNCKEPGIAGIAEIAREGYPDYTALDESHPYYDPNSKEDNPKWFMVDVKFVRKLNRFLALKELQSYKDAELSDMALIKRGRLSVQPVKKEEFEFILRLEEKE
ncbi:PUA-like domain-containing protein [Jimgerdemannia flammicorona]|uniref:PUA-like domain-containing protein n=1 Tax=Jimgerdemannia flammicorona TaxID=994334 RepID=A0A433D633_9FUNG|nr:PUA-like domain-containing protein [Jimgerdemannia flammicorona]